MRHREPFCSVAGLSSISELFSAGFSVSDKDTSFSGSAMGLLEAKKEIEAFG